MASFDRGETVICSIEIKDSTGAYKDPSDDIASPSTHTKITISDHQNGVEVNAVGMTRDSIGKYHYDWASTSTDLCGRYTVLYKATDDSRITIETDTFELEER